MRLSGTGLLVALYLLSAPPPAVAQTEADAPLRLEGLFPVGGRMTVTEAWSTLQFTVENRSSVAKRARVSVFYLGRPDLHFARDIAVPAHTRRLSWLSLGPAPALDSTVRRDIAYQLFDCTDGTHRPVGGREPERLQTRAEPYRAREPTTAVYLDEDPSAPPDLSDGAASSDDEPVRLAQAFRAARGLPERVSIIRERYLPPVAETLDGVDHLIISGNRLADDPPGQRAIRHWLLNGGTVWVLLDRVDPDVVAPLLGEALRFQVVGRTGLTTLRVRGARQERTLVETREFDRPVELVRVLLSGSETVHIDANDWPAAFSLPVGRGRVVFTTLGARGWYRPRTPRDPRPRLEGAQDLPVPVDALTGLSGALHPEHTAEHTADPLRPEDLGPMLTAEIGYEVVGRRAAGAILAAFLGGLLVIAVAVRRSRAPEFLGVAAPAVAALAAAAFVAAGASARRAVPPTAAAAAVVSVSPDSGEAEWRGLFAVYQPSSGEVRLSAPHGGRVDFDQAGTEGAARRRVETDLGAWHWENLSFPAGVRTGAFRSAGRTGVAVATRFGASGVEGTLALGDFRNPTDVVLQTRTGATFAVRIADGSFRVGPGDELPAGQYLPSALLTDRQQRRQEVYQKLLAAPKLAPPAADRLLVWAETSEVPFAVAGAERTVGTALLVVPLRHELAVGPVTVPSGFIPFTAVSGSRVMPFRRDGEERYQVRLRFQLPEGRPLAVERAALVARVRAPGRTLSVSGVTADDRTVPLFEQPDADGPVRVEVTDPQLLRPDAGGGLSLELVIGERAGAAGKPRTVSEPTFKWEIGAVGLEVTGRAQDN